MVRDVIEGLKLVGDGIEGVKKIADAVKTGEAYVKQKHPEIQADLHALVLELGKSVQMIKHASAVLTNFRFAVAADTQGSELRAFNDYYIKAKADAQFLRDHLENLRTHCSKVREYAERVSGEATKTGFRELFVMVGLHSRQREEELAEALDNLAYEDFAAANNASRMLDILELALKEVQVALGDRGLMHPENIPAAAALLAEYGPAFEAMETRAAREFEEIRRIADQLH